MAKLAFDYATKHGRKKVHPFDATIQTSVFPMQRLCESRNWGPEINPHTRTIQNGISTSQVTAVHKANIMKVGDGLFLKCCQEVAELYPEV